MDRSNKRAVARTVGLDAEDGLDILHWQPVTGGEPRHGQLTGTKALMLAVLEDGIRSYLGTSRIVAQDAEYWIYSHRRGISKSKPSVSRPKPHISMSQILC